MFMKNDEEHIKIKRCDLFLELLRIILCFLSSSGTEASEEINIQVMRQLLSQYFGYQSNLLIDQTTFLITYSFLSRRQSSTNFRQVHHVAPTHHHSTFHSVHWCTRSAGMWRGSAAGQRRKQCECPAGRKSVEGVFSAHVTSSVLSSHCILVQQRGAS